MMNHEGGYCIIRHIVGNSCYYARTFSLLTELKKIAPKMECLDMASTNMEAGLTEAKVAEWLQKHGRNLKGIFCSDDAEPMIGLDRALNKSTRNDIIVVSAGNCNKGMEFVESGRIQAMTYQSPEADGALSMETAIDWFNGIEVPPVRYLPMDIITKENLKRFYPGQW
jgi:ABC-type sugar transport system substrate-binding protein